MPFSKQNHIQHEICMFVSTGRVGSRTRILSNDLAGAATPVVIIVSLDVPQIDLCIKNGLLGAQSRRSVLGFTE